MIEMDKKIDISAQLYYITSSKCSSCWALKPKIEELLKEEFPKMVFTAVASEGEPEWCAKNRIFSAPTIMLFFEGREYQRFGKAVSIVELREAISRPYNMLFF